MAERRIGGIVEFTKNGIRFKAKGAFTYNLGKGKKEMVVGSDEVHGYKEVPQVPFIEGAITDDASLDLEAFVNAVDETIVLSLANGKVIALKEACYSSEGTVNSEEGEIEARFEGITADEIR